MKENKELIGTAKKVIKDCVKISDLFKEYRRFIDSVYKGEGEYMICCPFHGDYSPSLGINDKTGQWNCFGCEAGGDAVTALMWLARTVDRTYYSYGEAIDQLIQRNVRLRESLPFTSVMERHVSIAQILERPKLRYSSTKDVSELTMNDVYSFMKKSGKTTFADVAYASSMMMARQTPDQILSFMREDVTSPVTQAQDKAVVNAAALLLLEDD